MLRFSCFVTCLRNVSFALAFPPAMICNFPCAFLVCTLRTLVPTRFQYHYISAPYYTATTATAAATIKVQHRFNTDQESHKYVTQHIACKHGNNDTLQLLRCDHVSTINCSDATIMHNNSPWCVFVQTILHRLQTALLANIKF